MIAEWKIKAIFTIIKFAHPLGEYRMNILAHTIQKNYTQDLLNIFTDKCRTYVAPLTTSLSSLEYGQLISSLSDALAYIGRDALKATFEEMDLAFRNSPHRTSNYYVKQTRYRTIMTVFGEVTYKRTEYIERSTRKPYCYVDRKIKLRSRERFDCTVQSLIVETYANQNSMIKVGQLVGDRIAGAYSLNSNRKQYTIPRQTVYNILHRLHTIKVAATPVNETPDTLYVMADEKYIYLQGEDRSIHKYPKAMTKVAVVFEGRTKVSKDAKIPRYQLDNPYVFASTQDRFWESFHDQLNIRYDLTQVRKIYLLGDGASWIVAGAHSLSTQHTKVSYALDKFHANQAIQRITKDKAYTTLLTNYMITNMKNEFTQLVDSLLELYPDRVKAITEQKKYILTHWSHIQTMYKTVKIGCAMEQAIYHIIASVFSNVPKAYTRQNIETYLSNRVNHLNACDLRLLYLHAIDTKADDKNNVYLKPDEFDFSFFDTKNLRSTYPLHLNTQNFETITKF